MRSVTFKALAVVCLVGASSGSALAMGGGGNSGSGSGLSPYAADSGNDRSAGVNNGNYQKPQYNYYRRAYGPRWAPYPGERSRYYGYPY